MQFVIRTQPSDRCQTVFTFRPPRTGMDDIDPDAAMIAAGVVISLVAVLELYPAVKKARER
jgi:hypothetical protein